MLVCGLLGEEMSAKINPILCLSRVTFQQVLDKYASGFFAKALDLAPLSGGRSAPKIAVPISTDHWSGVYKTRDRFDNQLVYASSGNDALVRFMRTRELPEGGRCDFCKDDIPGVAVGIPRSVAEQLIILDQQERRVTTFWTEGRCCSFECALAHVRRCSEYLGSEAETNLRRMHRLQGNGGTLVPRTDLRLRLSEGGSLPDSEWRSTSTTYLNTLHHLCIPLKTEYLRQ